VLAEEEKHTTYRNGDSKEGSNCICPAVGRIRIVVSVCVMFVVLVGVMTHEVLLLVMLTGEIRLAIVG